MKQLIALLFIIPAQLYSQYQVNTYESLSNETLLELIDSETDSTRSFDILKTYLERAKLTKDTLSIARAYDRFARIGDPLENLKYVDSILFFTRTIRNITYPGQAYILKAHNLRKLGLIEDAIDNLISAYNLSRETGNVLHEAYSIHTIVHYKTYWGNPQEALLLQNDFIEKLKSKEFKSALEKSFRVKDQHSIRDYYEILITEGKLNKLFCHIELGHYNRAKDIMDSVLGEFDKDKHAQLYLYYLEAQMEVAYHLGNYTQTMNIIDSIAQATDQYLGKGLDDNANMLFIKGLTLDKMNATKEAEKTFILADSAYQKTNKLYKRKHRKIYEYLVDLYKRKGLLNKQLYYLKRQIRMDSLLLSAFKHVNLTIIEEFDTPQLLVEKEKLIAQLEWKQGRGQRKQLLIGFLLLFSLVATGYYFWKQREYKQQFKYKIKQGLASVSEESNKQKRNEVSKEVMEEILKRLERFEFQHQYTRSNISLQSVAKRFNTNSSYLSKVVNLKKDKNFSQYISDLRISYAVDQLQNNPKFRKYTIKAIAEEVGFGNAQSFSKAFKARTGLHPSYFIRTLKKTFPVNPTADSVLRME